MAVGKEIGAKLSTNTFGWDKTAIQTAVLADIKTPVFLYRIVGVVTGLKPFKDKETGETRFGSLGQYEMTSPQGEVAQGTVYYPPRYVQDMLEGALSMSDDIASIRIAYDVYAKHNEKSATSYAFTAFDLLQEGSESVDSVKSAIAELPLPTGSGAPKLEDKSKK